MTMTIKQIQNSVISLAVVMGLIFTPVVPLQADVLTEPVQNPIPEGPVSDSNPTAEPAPIPGSAPILEPGSPLSKPGPVIDPPIGPKKSNPVSAKVFLGRSITLDDGSTVSIFNNTAVKTVFGGNVMTYYKNVVNLVAESKICPTDGGKCRTIMADPPPFQNGEEQFGSYETKMEKDGNIFTERHLFFGILDRQLIKLDNNSYLTYFPKTGIAYIGSSIAKGSLTTYYKNVHILKTFPKGRVIGHYTLTNKDGKASEFLVVGNLANYRIWVEGKTVVVNPNAHTATNSDDREGIVTDNYKNVVDLVVKAENCPIKQSAGTRSSCEVVMASLAAFQKGEIQFAGYRTVKERNGRRFTEDHALFGTPIDQSIKLDNGTIFILKPDGTGSITKGQVTTNYTNVRILSDIPKGNVIGHYTLGRFILISPPSSYRVKTFEFWIVGNVASYRVKLQDGSIVVVNPTNPTKKTATKRDPQDKVTNYKNVYDAVVKTEICPINQSAGTRSRCAVEVASLALQKGVVAFAGYTTMEERNDRRITVYHTLFGILVSQRIKLDKGTFFYDAKTNTGVLNDGVTKDPFTDIHFMKNSVSTCPANPMILAPCTVTNNDWIHPKGTVTIGVYSEEGVKGVWLTKTSYTITGRPDELDIALKDLSSRTEIPVGELQIGNIKPREWPDSCLGLGGADEACAKVVTPGYRIELIYNQGEKSATFVYHTDTQGNVRLNLKESAAPLIRLAEEDLRNYWKSKGLTGLAEGDVVRLDVEFKVWSNSCLEINTDGNACLTVVTPGYKINIGVQSKNGLAYEVWEYRTDLFSTVKRVPKERRLL